MGGGGDGGTFLVPVSKSVFTSITKKKMLQGGVFFTLKSPVTQTTGTERFFAARATKWLPLSAISPPFATTA